MASITACGSKPDGGAPGTSGSATTAICATRDPSHSGRKIMQAVAACRNGAPRRLYLGHGGGPRPQEHTRRPAMDQINQEPREIRAEDINPRFNWGRALPALGIMGVDFEERVDYRRLHRYRLSRVRQALENSDLGALLVFDVNNIRYITSTKIGEWERDKLSRWALLTRG